MVHAWKKKKNNFAPNLNPNLPQRDKVFGGVSLWLLSRIIFRLPVGLQLLCRRPIKKIILFNLLPISGRSPDGQKARAFWVRHCLLLSGGFFSFPGTWIYALVLSVPPALGWNRFVPIPSRISCHPDWYSPNTVDKSYIIYLLMFGFFLPSVIIFCSYLGIYRYVIFINLLWPSQFLQGAERKPWWQTLEIDA